METLVYRQFGQKLQDTQLVSENSLMRAKPTPPVSEVK